MAFWAIAMEAGGSHTIPASHPPTRFRLTLVKTMHERSSCDVWVSVGGVPPVCFCHISKRGSAALDLEFEESQDIIFSVTGPSGVCLFGYYVRPLQPTVVNAALSDLCGEEAIVGPRPAEDCNKIEAEEAASETDSENENEVMMPIMKSNEEDEVSNYICGEIASFKNEVKGYCIVKRRKSKASIKLQTGNITKKKQCSDPKRCKLKNGKEEEKI